MKVRLTREEEYKLTTGEKLVMFYRAHPVQACKDLLGIELLWFQRILLRGMWFNKNTMLLLSRGIGKSYMMAVFAVLYAMLYPGVVIGVIAPTFKQTEFLFNKIAEIHINSAYFRACCPKIQRTSYRCLAKMLNGSYIEGLPVGTGDGIRGQRYNVVLIDEYATVDEDIIKRVIRPMLNVKRKNVENKYIIAGTAYYTWNHFYLQYLLYNVMSYRESEMWGLHEYIYEDVLMTADSPFQLDEDIYRMSRMDTTDEIFLMENKCLFPIENVGFISARLIDSCTPRETEERQSCPIELFGERGYNYVMGVDAARVAGGDNFSITVLKIKNGVKQFVYGFILNGSPYQEMLYHIRRVCRDFNVIQINMDASGGGTTIKDLLTEAYRMPDGEIMLPILDIDD